MVLGKRTATICCLLFAAAVNAGGCATGTAGATQEKKDPPRTYRVYVGTYTQDTGSRGIYRFDFDAATGKASEPVLACEATNPSFLAIHPSGRYLYAVGEVGQFKGRSDGSVSAYQIEPATGNLKPLNTQASRGAAPCHLVVDPSGRNVLVANYTGGSVASLPIQSDGSLGPASGFVQHQGKGADPQRQGSPHAHSINLDPSGRLAVVADLGLDKVFVYSFDPQKGSLTPHNPPFATVPSGGGPRHFAFHPSEKFAFTNNEMTSSVTAFKWDGKKGVLEPLQTITTLPQTVTNNTTAEVLAHPSGRFLYVSNRVHDSIAVFRVDPQAGRLTPAGHVPTGGKIPRNFNLDPSGQWLIAANQDSGNLVIFKVDLQTGMLTPTGQQLSILKPVCVRFMAVER